MYFGITASGERETPAQDQVASLLVVAVALPNIRSDITERLGILLAARWELTFITTTFFQ